MEVVASLAQGRTAAAQCGLFTYKSVPVIFEPPCIYGAWGSVVVKALRYQSDGPGIDSRWNNVPWGRLSP